MSKNSLLAVLSISVLVAVSFFFWYNVAPANDQPQPPALAPLPIPITVDPESDSIKEPAQSETYFNGNWTIASESFIGYRLAQTSENNEVVGRTNQLAGNAVIENNKVQKAQFSAPISSITSGDKSIDSIFASEMVQAETFPDLALILNSMQLPDGEKRAEGLPVAGALTLRDVTQEVAFTVDTQIGDDDKIELVAIIDVLLSDYRIAQPSDPNTIYSDEARIEAHLYLEKQS